MIYAPSTTAALGVVEDVQPETPLTLRGEGLWVCLISSGKCVVSLSETGAAPGGSALARGETCPAAAELMGRLAEEQDASERVRSQLAFALLCELSDADSAAPALPPLVAAAIEDIRRNYAGLYGVEELSERLGVSKSHLVRAFTAALGVIASLCGFSGANYLCRVFKKTTGQSPTQWRAMAGRSALPGLSPEQQRLEQELFI